MINLTLPIVTKSNNQLLRMHWAVRRRIKVSYMDELLVAIRESKYANRELLTNKKRKCHIISFRKRLLDADNLVGGLKPLIDCLVEWKLLKDDSPEFVELKIEQKKSKHPRTEIILKDMK